MQAAGRTPHILRHFRCAVWKHFRPDVAKRPAGGVVAYENCSPKVTETEGKMRGINPMECPGAPGVSNCNRVGALPPRFRSTNTRLPAGSSPRLRNRCSRRRTILEVRGGFYRKIAP